MPSDEQHDAELPAELVATLKDEYQAPPLITSRVDREVAQLAETHFRDRTETRRRRKRLWIAAAASVLVAVVLVQPQYRSSVAPPGRITDVDNSGQIDIADVLALARDNKNFRQAHLDFFAQQLVALNNSGDAS